MINARPRFSCAGAILALSWLLLAALHPLSAADLTSLISDRRAIEQVYHAHRLGTKPPFDEALPAPALERLVRDDLRKEFALQRVYGVSVTPALLIAEVQRIQTTTRAPEMLAEIKAALGQDPERFARAFAKPFLVDRLLRSRFENDDRLHATQRRLAETARQRVLDVPAEPFHARFAALKVPPEGQLRSNLIWNLSHRPAGDAPAAVVTAPEPTQGKARGGPYTLESTAQMAQAGLPADHPPGPSDPQPYFEDLPPDLQRVLRVQLTGPGAVSAVIESANAFQVYLARERTPALLSAAVWTLPKRSLEDWLASQPDP